jgi:hypothetical protein
MFRVQNVVDKASLLQLVRERVELLDALASIKCLKREAHVAACDEDLQRRLLAQHRAAQTRVARFDADNPEIADLFVFRRQSATAPVAAA